MTEKMLLSFREKHFKHNNTKHECMTNAKLEFYGCLSENQNSFKNVFFNFFLVLSLRITIIFLKEENAIFSIFVMAFFIIETRFQLKKKPMF